MDPVSIVALVGTSLWIATKGAAGLIQIYDFYMNMSNAPEDIEFLQDDICGHQNPQVDKTAHARALNAATCGPAKRAAESEKLKACPP
jgi:hypothetical protein